MTDNEPRAPRELLSAALHTAAEMIRFGAIPLPSSVDIWSHNVGRDQLLTLADRYEVAVTVHPKDEKTSGHSGHATVRLTEAQTGVYRTTFWVMSTAIEPADVRLYEDHNRECLTNRAPDAEA